MQQRDNHSQAIYNEDEIDLKELFKTIWNYKNFIILFTVIITVLVGFYAFMKPNIYQVNSVLEIGYYNSNSNSNSNILLENPQTLVSKLKTKFNVNVQGITEELPYISNITTIKKAHSLIKISALGLSKIGAKKIIARIDKQVIDRHLKLIDEYKKNINYQINAYQVELMSIVKTLQKLKSIVKIQKEKAIKLSEIDPSLSAIYIMEVLRQQDELTNLESKKFAILKSILNERQRLLPINIKFTKVIKTLVYKNKVKPKRKLIVIVGFITSFILSIFLVFFSEFIKNLKEE